jgi:mono/diheme cytochrome c family protein
VSVDLSDFGKKPLSQIDFGDTNVPHTWDDWVRNKLKNSRVFQTDRIIQKMPVFAFSDEEIEMLRMLLKSFQKQGVAKDHQYPVTTPQEDIDEGRRLTMWYNCINCHQIEGRGGYIGALYDEKALAPPVLTGEGAKVQEQWLHNFLQAPAVIRSWIKIRMPTFSLTDDEIATVTKYFLGISGQDFELRDYAATPIATKYLEPGKKLFESYQCAKCHPTGTVKPSETGLASILAPNLGLASGRLKPNWIIDWLHDPQKLQPGTNMPTFFYEGQAPDQTILGGNAEEQIKALRAYVWSLGKHTATAARQ